MSITHHHSEWQTLLDISGPFLSLPVLTRVFPQGLDQPDPLLRRDLRSAYNEWKTAHVYEKRRFWGHSGFVSHPIGRPQISASM